MGELAAWRGLAERLAAGEDGALLVVTGSRGSSPGRRGAVMAVGVSGPLGGTVGGGAAEAAVAEQVVGWLRSGALRGSRRIVLEHREGVPDASGMVCGGQQAVGVALVGPAQLAQVRQVVAALAAGRQVAWRLDDRGWALDAGPAADQRLGPDDDWPFVQRSGPSHVVHVVGAGHVGTALAAAVMPLGFRVVVLDERPDVDLHAVPAHEHARAPYESLGDAVGVGPTSCVAIATHAHDRDRAALDALIDLPLGYLGLLGSRAKVHRLVAGRTMPPWFHGPMGLPIGSATPEEIAVSVAAELVAVRAAARR
jgi:xanthine dehydrogenase accessory factor